jgi:hypothetical protein
MKFIIENVFGIEVTLDEIRDIYTSISNKIHENTNYLCLLLHLSNLLILSWYNQIVHMFSPELAIKIAAGEIKSGKNQTVARTQEEFEQLVQFIQRRELEPLVKDLMDSLSGVIDRGKLPKQLDDAKVNKIKLVISQLDSFKEKTILQKGHWLDSALTYGWDIIDPRLIYRWEKDLDFERQTIQETTNAIRKNLDCKEQIMKDLFMQLVREYIGKKD